MCLLPTGIERKFSCLRALLNARDDPHNDRYDAIRKIESYVNTTNREDSEIAAAIYDGVGTVQKLVHFFVMAIKCPQYFCCMCI